MARPKRTSVGSSGGSRSGKRRRPAQKIAESSNEGWWPLMRLASSYGIKPDEVFKAIKSKVQQR